MIPMLGLEHPSPATIVRAAIGLICFLAMGTCFLWAVILSLDRVNQVNEQLPPDQQIGFPLGFIGPERNARFEREYERLFSDRDLRKKERKLWLLGALALIGLAFAVGPLL
jgi:hypothetical protein